MGQFNFPILISALKAFDNFISENPGSIYREEALYYRIEAATTLAVNSTEDKKRERLEDALDSYNDLLRHFPESTFKNKADNLARTLQKELGAYEVSK